ncbi:RNA 2',3'-cyclic phosphodiesterase [Mesobacterium sp. TK19101]|uniref:RNA 2',3'-cyclic phosphodiesterase n=1 Tax=Mesobacterium hydrothermale TaxID=3111907 RepID=A0ABU6HC30_9RHOB|nr:RNA 2',3'-cyclic phosphodiesterase [Mesobacterium sp. TK19101]MEC3859692.1 RNA 2',3'-cyclic phosphodiesterase [Mesobacterium sp. TK19101]
MIRAFVGLPLPDACAEALGVVQDRLSAGRDVPRDNLHLTLAFLGAQPESVLEDLHGLLERVTAPPMTLRFSGYEMFGGTKPRLLAALVALNPALQALRAKVRRAAYSVGIDLPRERFRPHVTLTRFAGLLTSGEERRVRSVMEGAVLVPDWPVEQMVLYRSVLNPSGARYDALADYPLAPGAPAF